MFEVNWQKETLTMSRLAFRFIVVCVTVTIGMAATYLYYMLSPKSVNLISIQENRLEQNAPEKKRTYELKQQALGDYRGYRICVTALESSDGMTFFSATMPCETPKQASKELERKLRQAVDIIRREALLDEAGSQVGQKVVATFAPYNGSSTGSAEMIWTRGSDFGYVRSSALGNILEYDKDHKF